MNIGESHILTTHTGSLPRPSGLVSMLGSVSRGESVDQVALDAEAHEAVAHEVSEQLNARVGVIDTKANYVEHPRLIADRLHQVIAATDRDPTRVLAGAD